MRRGERLSPEMVEHTKKKAGDEQTKERAIRQLEQEIFGRSISDALRRLIREPRLLVEPAFSESGFPAHDIWSRRETTKKGVRFREKDLTQFGLQVQQVMRGRTIVDLGAGTLALNKEDSICRISQELGAKRYIAVDIAISESYAKQVGTFEVYVIRADMLAFVSQLKEHLGVSYVLGTLVPPRVDQEFIEYVEALRGEMIPTMNSGDAIILYGGSRFPIADLEEKGFNPPIRQGAMDMLEREIWVKK